MTFLPWNDCLATGVAIIDQQHQGLLNVLNETASRVNSEGDLSTSEIRRLLAYLVDYATVHFGTEEALMALNGVDNRHVKHHQQSHSRFSEQLSAMLADLDSAAAPTARQLVEFLGNWLISHILCEDQSMGRQLRSIAEGATTDQAFLSANQVPSGQTREAITLSLSRLYGFMARSNPPHGDETEKHDAAQAATLLADAMLFQGLSREQLDKLASSCREKRLHKGEFLFRKGDRPQSFYLVASGQIKLAISSAQGHEKVLHIVLPGQTFGEAELFIDRTYPMFAQALGEVHLFKMRSAELFELLAADAGFARRLLGCLGVRLHDLVLDMESCTLLSAKDRVVAYLLQQARRNSSGQLEVGLPTSKNNIASLLHLTPETFSRILHDLNEAGVIQGKGRSIVICVVPTP